uniref:G-protein coupled receptors family 1 profile domain-containing protein n=1 Tax=Timema bartmani TaxID=61472 RepID=A0A7R9F8R9_9NEOP|nr:unnamed protein product [Timema bartmani]
MDSPSVVGALSKEKNISLEEMYISYPRSATILAAACAVIFSVIGVTGNLVTALALLRCRKLRKHATTAFVISLSVSDLLFSAINLPLTASRYVNEAWVLGPTLCKLFPFFFYGNVAVSLLSMVAITINRMGQYVKLELCFVDLAPAIRLIRAIAGTCQLHSNLFRLFINPPQLKQLDPDVYVLISCHLLYDNVYTSCHIGLMILFAWSFSFSMMLPPLVEVWGQLGLHPPTFSCTILNKDGSSPKKFLFLLGFVIPCIVIIASYSCIYWKVLESRKKLRSHSSVAAHKSTIIPASAQICQNREDFRLTWMMLIIFCCFLLCFLPLMLVNVIDDEVNLPTLHVLASVLAWASSVINPFIYAGSNKQYRTAYKKLFCNYKDHPELFIEKQHRVLLSVRAIRITDYANGLGIGKVEFRRSESAIAWRESGKPFRKIHPQFTRPRFGPQTLRPQSSSGGTIVCFKFHQVNH